MKRYLLLLAILAGSVHAKPIEIDGYAYTTKEQKDLAYDFGYNLYLVAWCSVAKMDGGRQDLYQEEIDAEVAKYKPILDANQRALSVGHNEAKKDYPSGNVTINQLIAEMSCEMALDWVLEE